MSIIFAIFIVMFPMILFLIGLLWDYHDFKKEINEIDDEFDKINEEMD